MKSNQRNETLFLCIEHYLAQFLAHHRPSHFTTLFAHRDRSVVAEPRHGSQEKIQQEALSLFLEEKGLDDMITFAHADTPPFFQKSIRMDEGYYVPDDRMTWSFLRTRLPRALIMGDTNAGRSTFLQEETYLIAQEQIIRLAHGHDVAFITLPIYLHSTTLLASLEAASMVLKDALCHVLLNHGWVPLEQADWFKAILGSGQCVLLVDEIDMLSESQRKRVQQALQTFAHESAARILISSRPFAYQQDSFHLAGHFERVRLLPLNAQQKTRFLHQCFAGKRQLGTQLHQDLRHHPAFWSQLSSPFLLSWLCQWYAHAERLPESRVQLYEQWLARWVQKSTGQDESPYLLPLEQLAWYTATQQASWQSTFSLQQVQQGAVAFPSLQAQIRTALPEAWNPIVLPIISDHPDLSPGYRFLHPTLHAFLVARYIIRHFPDAPFDQVYALQRLNQHEWMEVFLFLGGLLGPVAVLQVIEEQQIAPILAGLLALEVPRTILMQKHLPMLLNTLLHQKEHAGLLLILSRIWLDQQVLVLCTYEQDDARLAESLSVLGQLRHPHALSFLETFIQQRTIASSLRWIAIDAIGSIGGDQAEHLLDSLFSDPDVHVRCLVAWHMSCTTHPHSRQLLREALHDPDASVRSVAAWALGQTNDITAVPLLLRCFVDTSEMVRRCARDACKCIHPFPLLALAPFMAQSSQDETRELAMAVFMAHQPAVSRQAMTVCREKIPWKNLRAAILARGRLGEEEWIPDLEQVVHDEFYEIIEKEHAIRAIEAIGGTHAEQVLFSLFQVKRLDWANELSHHLNRAISVSGGLYVMAWLREALASPTHPACSSALGRVSSMDRPALFPELQALLLSQATPLSLKTCVLSCLAQYDRRLVRPLLDAALTDEHQEMVQAALKVFLRWHEQDLPPVVEAMVNDISLPIGIRGMALELTAQARQSSVPAQLVQALHDPGLRFFALRALKVHPLREIILPDLMRLTHEYVRVMGNAEQESHQARLRSPLETLLDILMLPGATHIGTFLVQDVWPALEKISQWGTRLSLRCRLVQTLGIIGGRDAAIFLLELFQSLFTEEENEHEEEEEPFNLMLAIIESLPHTGEPEAMLALTALLWHSDEDIRAFTFIHLHRFRQQSLQRMLPRILERVTW